MNIWLDGRARVMGLVVVGTEVARTVDSVTACRDAQLRLVADFSLGLDFD